jgi:hypothetical protein
MVKNRMGIRFLARIAFVASAILILVLTVSSINSPVGFNDKLEHLGAFSLLATLGVIAWGPQALPVLAVGLLALGGLIELAQATPWIQRDADAVDWLADAVGVAIILVPAWLLLPRFQPRSETNRGGISSDENQIPRPLDPSVTTNVIEFPFSQRESSRKNDNQRGFRLRG